MLSFLFDLVLKFVIMKKLANFTMIGLVLLLIHCKNIHGYKASSTEFQSCDPAAKYRSFDGTCNNLMYPDWGKANTCRPRLIRAYYEGASEFRKSVTGNDLPSARKLSATINYDNDKPTSDVSHMFAFFGQFVDHDITDTGTYSSNSNGNCCNDENRNTPACKPIYVSPDDPFYSKYNVTCLDFSRSTDCGVFEGKRQIPNVVTPAIDCSFLYSESEEESRKLRNSDGTLVFTESNNGELLPLNKDNSKAFCPASKLRRCFTSGDGRINQHTMLLSQQTMWLREHNRIARELRRINGHWNGEKIFQETRRILGAIFQSIIYREYIPVLLGNTFMTRYGLRTDINGSMYNPEVDFRLTTEFSGAVFRLHTLVNYFVNYDGYGTFRFMLQYGNPDPIHDGYTGNLLKGATSIPSQSFDRFISEDLSGRLLQMDMYEGEPYGEDIAAIDIQRGRDQGLPPYVQMLRFVYGNHMNIQSFEDLNYFGLVSFENCKLLQESYENVEDIDLWIGLNIEMVPEGDVLGPTSSALIASQFQKLKLGDRFFFTHKNLMTSFTDGQLRELLKASLSKLVCDNTNVSDMPLNSMLLPSFRNPEVSCDRIQGINLEYWRE